MTAPTAEGTKIGFADFAEKLEEAKSSAVAEVVKELPIDAEVKTTILISVEDTIKKLLSNLANKNEIGWGIDTNPEDFAHLPNSITGVVVHYIVKGIKEDFGFEFKEKPKCLTYNMSKTDKKVAGKKRLLTRDQKNEIIEKMQMSYYEKDLAEGKITMEDAMESIKDAFNTKKGFEEMGYMLPPAKTAYPFWQNEDGEEEKTD